MSFYKVSFVVTKIVIADTPDRASYRMLDFLISSGVTEEAEVTQLERPKEVTTQ